MVLSPVVPSHRSPGFVCFVALRMLTRNSYPKMLTIFVFCTSFLGRVCFVAIRVFARPSFFKVGNLNVTVQVVLGPVFLRAVWVVAMKQSVHIEMWPGAYRKKIVSTARSSICCPARLTPSRKLVYLWPCSLSKSSGRRLDHQGLLWRCLRTLYRVEAVKLW